MILGLVTGNTYTIRSRAHNIQGWGAYSPVLTVVSSAIPDHPLPATTAIVNLDLQISWDAEDDNYSPIISYIVKIGTQDGLTFLESMVYCDGSTSQVLSNKICLVPVSKLRQAPWNLQFDKLVQAVVQSCNRNGCSAPSEKNLVGARIQTEPVG